MKKYEKIIIQANSVVISINKKEALKKFIKDSKRFIGTNINLKKWILILHKWLTNNKIQNEEIEEYIMNMGIDPLLNFASTSKKSIAKVIEKITNGL